VGGFVEADFDGGEAVIAAAEGEAGGVDEVGLGEVKEELVRGCGGFLLQGREIGRDGEGVEGAAGEREELVRR
jgi:hypothetical protein